ncbi:MAG: hypothetical protein KJZ73_18490 [Pseudorhodoplanes sp.]|nr:hypothetical protein [Pseudorhodoplanes sp.]MBW7948442.1 hypothetical protein [Pseudorhodoplanes sp.]MCL4713232.1 hypothetical protein [Pseudorhodoplanes sp.]GIK81967.1 MAG: hypothetical protein BroJett024_30720 [Alphaproteobacteria bacterium]
MRLQGYYAEEDAAPIVDFDKMERDAKILANTATEIPITAQSRPQTIKRHAAACNDAKAKKPGDRPGFFPAWTDANGPISRPAS